jgi:hypothetical protein
MLGGRPQPILENIALAAGGTPEPRGGNARGAVESADKVREVVETDIESDIGDGASILG